MSLNTPEPPEHLDTVRRIPLSAVHGVLDNMEHTWRQYSKTSPYPSTPQNAQFAIDILVSVRAAIDDIEEKS